MDKKTTFQSKIQKEFLSYVRIPFLLLILLVVFYLLYVVVFERFYISSKQHNQILNSYNNLVSEINTAVAEIKSDEDLYSFFSDSSNSNSIYQFYYSLANERALPVAINLYNSDKELLLTTMISTEGSVLNKVTNRVIMDITTTDDLVFSTALISSIDEQVSTIIFSQKIQVGSNEGYILFYVKPSYFGEYLRAPYDNHIVITDRFGYVLGTTSERFIGAIHRFNPNNNTEIEVDDHSYEIRSAKSSDNAIIVNSLLDEVNFLEDYGLVLLVLVLVVVVSTVIYKRLSKKIANEAVASIDQLLASFETIKTGDFTTRVSIKSGDEFEVLGEQFNTMVQTIDGLIENNQRLNELKKNAQIKQLEAQFNPHFLYNSLETIRYLAFSDAQKAEEMILALTSLLRYSIDNKINDIPLEDDLTYIISYLETIKLRLQDSFTYQIEISEAAKPAYIPKLIIQPIIENSVKYSYIVHDYLNITIKAYCEGDMLVLEISDDGGGIAPDILEELTSIFSQQVNPSNYYGLYSVQARLELIYGISSKMEIVSSSEGTTIIIRIPLRYENV